MGVKITSNIIFLGTGGDSYVVGRQLRGAGGIILQVDDDQFHMDPGPGALVHAKDVGINLRANTALLVSHNHINHCNDINAVIDAMTYSGFDKKGVLVSNRTAIHGSEKEAPFLHKKYLQFLERFIVLDAGKRVGINDIEIEAIKAKHADSQALGFKFIAPDYTLTYTGDTAYHADTVMQYSNSDVLILNVPFLKGEEGKHNLSKEDAIRILNRINPRLAILTHFGINFLKANPLYEIREIQKETNCQVIAARDGMVVNPVSYSVEQGQKTLYKYEKKEGLRFHEYLAEHNKKIQEINEMIHERQTTLENSSENAPQESEQ